MLVAELNTPVLGSHLLLMHSSQGAVSGGAAPGPSTTAQPVLLGRGHGSSTILAQVPVATAARLMTYPPRPQGAQLGERVRAVPALEGEKGPGVPGAL